MADKAEFMEKRRSTAGETPRLLGPAWQPARLFPRAARSLGRDQDYTNPGYRGPPFPGVVFPPEQFGVTCGDVSGGRLLAFILSHSTKQRLATQPS